MSEWQEIETAPKDGAVFLIVGGVAHFHFGELRTLTGCEYPGKPVRWNARHWMPLPLPPED